MKEILIFDVWGEYGHFRKYYTTTSPLTYSFPPRTAACGLIAAIIGIDKEEYLKHFTKEKANIAIRIINPVKKILMSENLVDTKVSPMMSRIKQRTQIRFEFLYHPKYRIYLNHIDPKIMTKLETNLQHHQSYYTPCLGLSELVANFNFVNKVSVKQELPNSSKPIHSVIPKPLISSSIGSFADEGSYFTVTVPNEMLEDRTVNEYIDILYEANGSPISVKVNEYYSVSENENIIFL